MVVSIGELSVRKNHQIIIKALGKLDTSKYVYVICGNDMNASGTSACLKELAEDCLLYTSVEKIRQITEKY